jgi:uncharacterized protein DUF3551
MGTFSHRRKRIWIAIGGLAITLSATNAAPARAEMWCVRDFGAAQGACVFPSARDCFRAVSITGGICEREPVGRQLRRDNGRDDGKRRRERRSAVER